MSKQTNIYQKLHNVMKDMGYITKEKSKGMPYSFASHNQVTNKVKEQLVKHNLMIIPFVKEGSHDGNSHKVIMAAKIIDIETKEELAIGDFPGIGNDNQDKGYGKAISYAYKYLLQKLFMMPIGDDEEADHQSVETETVDKKWINKFANDLIKSVDIFIEDPQLTKAEKVHEIIELKKKVKTDFERLENMDRGAANMLAHKINQKIEELKPNDANTKST